MDHSDLADSGRAGARRAGSRHASTPMPAPPTGALSRNSDAVTPVPPLDVDGVRTVALGTALWGLALLGLLPFHDWLDDTGRLWWLWTCSAGLGLGLLGLDLCLKRRARANEELRARTPASGGRRRR